MSMHITADDWQVAGFGSLSAAEGLGGGVWLFKFKSETAGYARPDFLFAFVGAGSGLGLDFSKLLKLGGAIAKAVKLGGNLSTSEISYSPITVRKPFGMEDLDFTFGVLATAGAGIVEKGYSATVISARPYFNRELSIGPQLALGAGAMIVMGYWIKID